MLGRSVIWKKGGRTAFSPQTSSIVIGLARVTFKTVLFDKKSYVNRYERMHFMISVS